jgi:hypothetical protein
MKRLWHGFLDLLDRIAAWPDASPDWTDPDNAPPAFDGVMPHGFKQAPSLSCCLFCGGGAKNPIHKELAG